MKRTVEHNFEEIKWICEHYQLQEYTFKFAHCSKAAPVKRFRTAFSLHHL